MPCQVSYRLDRPNIAERYRSGGGSIMKEQDFVRRLQRQRGRALVV